MTGDHSAHINGAGRADEARTTAAQPGAVTCGAVTTRVVGETVRRGTSATNELRRTRAAVTGDQVGTSAAVQTWS